MWLPRIYTPSCAPPGVTHTRTNDGGGEPHAHTHAHDQSVPTWVREAGVGGCRRQWWSLSTAPDVVQLEQQLLLLRPGGHARPEVKLSLPHSVSLPPSPPGPAARANSPCVRALSGQCLCVAVMSSRRLAACSRGRRYFCPGHSQVEEDWPVTLYSC